MRLACAGYAVVAIVLSLVVFYGGRTGVPGPLPVFRLFGIDAGMVVLCILYLLTGFFALGGRSWAFWLGLVVFGVLTAPGVVMVPLRGAESGVLNSLGISVALVNDSLAAFLVLWMLTSLRRWDRADASVAKD